MYGPGAQRQAGRRLSKALGERRCLTHTNGARIPASYGPHAPVATCVGAVTRGAPRLPVPHALAAGFVRRLANTAPTERAEKARLCHAVFAVAGAE